MFAAPPGRAVDIRGQTSSLFPTSLSAVTPVQIIPAPKGSGADWDVHWATMTFSVRAR